MIHLLFGIVAAACTFVQFVWENVQQANDLPLCDHPPRIRFLSTATRVSAAPPVEQAEFRNRDVELPVSNDHSWSGG
jgi:hypothetical protein